MGVGFSFIRASVSVALVSLAAACATLESRARDALDDPGIEGTRWGLVVTAMDGRELIAIRPDERFMPASNTKLFTVAAAFHRLGDVTRPDPAMGASVRVTPRPDGPPDIVLVGGGDAILIDAGDCERDCLSSLADMIVANGVKSVGRVIGDDTLYPDQRWGKGWTQEDLILRSGAPASALTVNSNEVMLEIAPGEAPNARALVTWRKGDDFFDLLNTTVMIEGAEDRLRIERPLGSNSVRIFGELGMMTPPQTIPLAVEKPAMTAAWRLQRLLEERGVVVANDPESSHRKLRLDDDPPARGEAPPQRDVAPGVEVARLLPPPLIDDIRFLMKQSQNQHAEMLLRRLGLVEGGGSVEDGLAIVTAMMDETGAERAAWDLSDGSGMSTYNRVTPRTVARLLRWTSQQPWDQQFRATLPIGGIDGTLSRRFRGTLLEGRIFAKTGTLKGTNALSGFMLTKGGEMLIFSAYANDRPEEAGSATIVLDQALVAIAESR